MLLCRDRGEGRVAGLGVIWPVFFFKKAGKRGEEGGGAGGGSGKCKLIGSKRILMFAAAFGQQRLAHKLAQNGINPPTSPPPKHFRAVKFNREMFLSPNDLHVF